MLRMKSTGQISCWLSNKTPSNLFAQAYVCVCECVCAHTIKLYKAVQQNGAKSDTCAGFILICMPSKFAFASTERDSKRWQRERANCLTVWLSKSQVNVQIFTLKYANMTKTECEHFRTLHLKLLELELSWLQLGQVLCLAQEIYLVWSYAILARTERSQFEW